jgi:glycosyltransferase involved in cell wall biosynthesis
MKNTDQINNQNASFTNALNFQKKKIMLPEILVISTFPPRECGIATYSQDLIYALNNKFENSFQIKICALDNETEKHKYTDEVAYKLETNEPKSYIDLAKKINQNKHIEIVLLQHEFGLFRDNESDLITFLQTVNKPKIVAFHTVLPKPNYLLKRNVQQIDGCVDSIIVMTNSSAKILINEYDIDKDKIAIIPHGTHLVEFTDKVILKEKYNVSGRKIISTFGLLSSGKCIETSINALRDIVQIHPEVLFLVIGKTHPTVVKNEGEKYRESLEERISTLGLNENVKFINQYLPLNVLLDYLQLTDIYMFTSKDRNQAVSGTFSYAISCGCPIISTPIPHAVEVLKNGTGIIIDFENPEQLAKQVIHLLDNEALRKNISANGIHKLAPTAWENSAIAHALLFEKSSGESIKLKFKIPEINLNHLKKMTTSFGLLQFSIINKPDVNSGYTLDDNARALVALCQHYELTKDPTDLDYIQLYFDFIKFCLQPEGNFFNYVSIEKTFTIQNNENLDDSNGRAIWALGTLLSVSHLIPDELIQSAEIAINKAISNVLNIHSTRAMAFIIKGIYLSNLKQNAFTKISLIQHFANKLVQMYRHEADEKWHWYESYLTYGNSILPEAMLCAYLSTGEIVYKNIAKTSFDFLLTKIFRNDQIKVISNKGWLLKNQKNEVDSEGGEQPIDIAYTINALSKFYDAFRDEEYYNKIKIAFDWFLGDNHLHQIIYNPATGGCYDGLEDYYINLNQGAESTVSFLMARLMIAKNTVAKSKIYNLNNAYLKPKEYKTLNKYIQSQNYAH